MNSLAPLSAPPAPPSQAPAWTLPRRVLRAVPVLAPAPPAPGTSERVGPPAGVAPPEGAALPEPMLFPVPEPDPHDPLAAAHRVARVVAQAVAEALRGQRTVTQLGHHLDLESYRKVERRVRWEREARALAGQRHAPAALRPLSCHVQATTASTCECTATLVGGDRARGLAFRLELSRGRWRCVEVEIG